MASPLVSVIIATHNRANILHRSLDSMFAQTYQPTEIIVVDDHSSDNTLEVLKKYQETHPTLSVIGLEKNGGPGVARNIGIRAAKGKYVAIMDDDDQAVETRLEKQVQLLEADNSIDLCFGVIQWLNDGRKGNQFPGVAVYNKFPANPRDAFVLMLENGSKIPNQTVVAKREIFLQYPYAEDVYIAEDWSAFLRMTASGVKMKTLSDTFVYVERSANRQGLMMKRQKAYQDQLKVFNHICKTCDVPPDLRRRALSNLYNRNASAIGQRQGVILLIRALLLWPGNPFAHNTLRKFMGKLRLRLRANPGQESVV